MTAIEPPLSPGRSLSAVRVWSEVLIVLILGFVGLVIGGLSGWIALGPILGVLLSIGAASLMLAREGSSWRDLGFARSMPIKNFLLYTLATLLVVFVVTSFLVTPLMKRLGVPEIDVSLLSAVIEGNMANYLLFLIPISWGSAAFGEELIARGFLQHRFSSLYGPYVAVVAQAAIFAAAHLYQGLTGVANIFALAVVFGVVYLHCGRNLWPLIAAHGLIDTLGMTLLYLGRTDLLVGSSFT